MRLPPSSFPPQTGLQGGVAEVIVEILNALFRKRMGRSWGWGSGESAQCGVHEALIIAQALI